MLSCFDSKRLKKGNLLSVLFCCILLTVSSCYKPSKTSPDAWVLTQDQQDSISFRSKHHYAQNYNFVVRADSLCLSCSQPDELPFDSVVVYDNDHIVVADFMIMSDDTIDSVWVKVARDQSTQGWIRECHLLPAVSPDDPIAWFIDLFDNINQLLALALLVIVGAAYGLRLLMKRKARVVHFNDIPSPYPTLLALTVAISATVYSSIQNFDPESWRHFYYHPTLNPFALPFHLGVFMSLIWLMIVLGIAAIDDIRQHLYRGEAVIYACGLIAVCSIVYVIFSLTTLYYIGYLLLPVYISYALKRYFRYAHGRYICGRCGEEIPEKGICPHCEANNE